MSKADILRKLQAYKKNPNLIKEVSPQELADLVLVVMGAVQAIDEAIKAGRLDGYTPKADKDYLSQEASLRIINQAVQKMLAQTDTVLAETSTVLEQRVAEALQNLRNGNDGIVTDVEIERAAQLALSMIELPNFDALVEERITANPLAIRDSLELISDEDEKLEQSAIKGLLETLQELKSLINTRSVTSGGGIGRATVIDLINQYGGGSGVPNGGTTGQVLTKLSNTDGDADWQDATGGGTGYVPYVDANADITFDGTAERAISAGTAGAANDGANMVIVGGAGGTGDTNGGEVQILGGQSSGSGTGGDVLLQPGGGGAVRISDTDLAKNIRLRLTGLTTDHEYIFPDNDGTIALTSDITGGSGVINTKVAATPQVGTTLAITGTVNGSNTIFATPTRYVTGTLVVYLDGRETQNGDEWDETTPSSGTFTFNVAPPTGSRLTAVYQDGTYTTPTEGITEELAIAYAVAL